MTNRTDVLARALLRAISQVDYVAGGDDQRDDPAQVVSQGLEALLQAGYDADFICQDTQFDRDQLPGLDEEQRRRP